MSEELIQNLNKLQESILLKNYLQSIQTCQDIELELEEIMVLRHEFPTDIFKRNHFDFYSTYLLCLLRNHQYDEAKYLWKRSPEQFKQSNNNHTYPAPSTPSSSSSSSTLFAWTWELGKLFFTQQRAKAIQYIQSALATSSSSFPENILVLLQDLLDYHLQLFFFQLQNAYQPLVISKVAQHLETTEDAVNQYLLKFGYQLNEQGEVTNESNTFQQSVVADQVKKDVLALQKLTEYAHQLEREGLKVDLTANTTSSNPNSAGSATPGKSKGHK
mmetsp:Transcript_8261/g.9031  ORF Transcript_8261/g.9031 Transcript_8261/m.9031 type:complete len:273 (-) Transcript_8261:37-855(-)|eukprot:gene1255-1330_t